jgi:hypothetical protein
VAAGYFADEMVSGMRLVIAATNQRAVNQQGFGSGASTQYSGQCGG